MSKLQKIIFYLFAALLFFVPLILWPFTSEVFEFNKMVLVYVFTTLIVGTWAVRCISVRKFIFRRTILDVPLLVFLGSQLISTVLSIDPLTSWLGYYSRFNGGLVSTVCYSLLYWALVSNFNAKQAIKLIYITLVSAALVSFYGVFEHFGIDKNIWVQDVQSRVFSTLGQPNWLAAWIVALMPISWALALGKSEIRNLKSETNSKFQILNSKFLIYFSLSILFFWTLIFTKSRSGILGLEVAFLIFWGGYFWLNRKEYKKFLSPFVILLSSFLIVCLISGTQFTSSIAQLITRQDSRFQIPDSKSGPALETGGTESGTIRKIVWTGALQVWLHYPVFGTGVETFAYSYYKYRPAEHNLVSEWDFIYNKAHNEFLNMAANSGMVGLIAYLVLIGSSIRLMFKDKNLLNFALLAGYSSLLATNFFGFSVVPTQLELFLFPALAITLGYREKRLAFSLKPEKINPTQKAAIAIIAITILYTLYAISNYWFADTLYNKGRAYNGSQKPDVAVKYLSRAISLESGQPLYHNEIAGSYAVLATYYYHQKDANAAKKFSDIAVAESDKAVSLSPANVNLKRSRFGVFVMLSVINPNYLLNARDTLIDAITYAPTDAKLYYNLGLVYARIGEPDKALVTLKKTVELKANYKEARLAYALLLIDKKQNTEAKAQLEYILKYIDPNDSLTKQTLESIK